MELVGARQSAIASSQPVHLDRVLRRFLEARLLSKAEVVARAEVEVGLSPDREAGPLA